ncbi:hypothetical protein N0V88_005523 [Collariella sp. IMI 366227]|nr:hypothetical protein N0V88_005523 [Collariella sp. IMI 366227]
MGHLHQTGPGTPSRVFYWGFQPPWRLSGFAALRRILAAALACREAWGAVAELNGTCRPGDDGDGQFWLAPHDLVLAGLCLPETQRQRPWYLQGPLRRGVLQARREVAVQHSWFTEHSAEACYRWMVKAQGLETVVVVLQFPTLWVNMAEAWDDEQWAAVDGGSSDGGEVRTLGWLVRYDDKEQMEQLASLWARTAPLVTWI